MKKINFLWCALLVFIISISSLMAQKSYDYVTYPNDPLQVREYTLDNGLKVFMSVYKDAPKIQTYIAVRAGSKNDPAETTGLAHYLEHMMFKGTKRLGTKDWEKEQVYIQKIEDLFEAYRMFEDPATRTAIYKMIDSLSYEASKLAIANEYDKAMSAIGSTGTNAFTSNDYTMYVENIPNNQLEAWAMIQADRFQNLVLRLFHTELETIYEEKNMSLTKDGRKANEAMFSALFPNHPYGTQTTLGEAEHLKNPSMRNIRNFVAQYYVPNNMCISLAGDFNPDEAIKIIEKYWGDMKPGEVPQFQKKPESPITTPIVKEIVGLEAENTTIAFRIDQGNGSRDVMLADLLETILNNEKCGLIDLNINQKQKCLMSYAYTYSLNDYAAFMFGGYPLPGQSLQDVQQLFFEQIELVKAGKFEDWLLEAAINNMKLSIMKRAESNDSRARLMAYAFVQNTPWSDVVNEVNEVSKITKKEIVDFANKIFKDNNYVIVNKKQGTPNDVAKVVKPPITPIEVGRDAESAFLKEIKSLNVNPIDPVYVDFSKDLTKAKLNNGLEVLYVKNNENKTFNLDYYFDFGSDADKIIDLAAGLLEYLSTSKYSAEQIQQEFYKLACNYSLNVNGKHITLSISGLSENMEKAITLVEEIFTGVQPNDEAYEKMVDRMLKSRNDRKANQQAVFSALYNYGVYGENSPTKDILSEQDLRALKSADLVKAIQKLFNYKHRILYYGPESMDDVKSVVARLHKVPAKFEKSPVNKKIIPNEVVKNSVLFVNYDAKQSYLREYFRGQKFNVKLAPQINLYNEYFGGSMNAIVFQEMREKRSLAYSAQAYYAQPYDKDSYYQNWAFIATQNDKLMDALAAFENLFEDMPIAEANYQLAKESLISNIRTSRTTKRSIIFNYLHYEEMGYDMKKTRPQVLFEAYPLLTMQDIIDFNHKYIKGQKKTIMVLGKEEDMDFNALSKYGKVTKLSLEQIFGF